MVAKRFGTDLATSVFEARPVYGPARWPFWWLDPAPTSKMLTARATTSTPMPSDTIASVIISLAHRLIAETSVGLNAVAVQTASDR